MTEKVRELAHFFPLIHWSNFKFYYGLVGLSKSLSQVAGCLLHECQVALHWLQMQGTHPSTIPYCWMGIYFCGSLRSRQYYKTFWKHECGRRMKTEMSVEQMANTACSIELSWADSGTLSPVQICSSWIASSFIMFITKPPTELLKTELSVTFGSGRHLLIWSK